MNVRTEQNNYHVGFELDRSGPRAITRCKIFLLTGVSRPTLVSSGETLQGKKDVFNSVTGCRFALKRALANYGFQKSTRKLFWKEFRRSVHRLGMVTCREAFANVGGAGSGFPKKLIDVSKAFENEARRVCGYRIVAPGGLDWCTKHRVDCATNVKCSVSAESTPGYGGLYSFQRRAMKKMLALGNPTGRGPAAFYMQRRHEYHDVNNGPRTYEIRKLYGLGWKKIMGPFNETLWPRSEVEKMRQLAAMYNGFGDYSRLERRVLRQAEDRCHRAGDPVPHEIKIINTMSHADVLAELTGKTKIVRDILKQFDENRKRRQWLRGIWQVADERLTARMLSLSLSVPDEFKRVDAELLRRPGITKVCAEYIIDPKEFVSEFKIGEVVTSGNNVVQITKIDGVELTVQIILRVFGYTVKFGPTWTVMDWEVKKKMHWLRRAGRALLGYWFETAIDRMVRADAEVKEEDYGRGLWKMIQDNYCDECHGRGDFLQGPQGGSCENIECRYCGQRYWIDPATQTAKKI